VPIGKSLFVLLDIRAYFLRRFGASIDPSPDSVRAYGQNRLMKTGYMPLPAGDPQSGGQHNK
jgi:hypothetical protein